MGDEEYRNEGRSQGRERGDREPRGDQRDAVADAAAADESDITTNWDEITPTFDAMDLKEDLLRGNKYTLFNSLTSSRSFHYDPFPQI